jgi:hypothetical protein
LANHRALSIPVVALLAAGLSTTLCGRLEFTRLSPPERDFELADLFLPASSFPPEWEIIADEPIEACSASPLGSGCPTYGEIAYYYFRPTDLWVTETIFHFLSTQRAKAGFRDAYGTEFLTWPDEQPWTEAPALAIHAPHATQLYSSCRETPVGRECGVAAQYEEFVVIFMARKVHLSNTDIALVVAAIDDRMSSFLQ